MKKRWIPVIVLCIVAAFVTGLRFGSTAVSEPEDFTDPAPIARHFNTTIAVVNADIGTMMNGVRYNYSAAIISSLGAEFELASPAMAQTGLAGGTYGAIVTFPPEVSERILSFNAHEPRRVELEFQINPELPEREYLEVYITITELQMAVNNTLASTYVSSILRQFHEAQDQVDGVFRNTLSDLMALEYITLGDFTASLALDEMPYIPLNPRELDVTFYMEQVAAFAEEVSGWYRNSYAMASDQYLWMREGLFALTEGFPEQEEEWLYMLSLWTGYSERYGDLLEQYSEYVRLHEEALVAWHEENVEWNRALEDYQHQVEDWHQDSNFWFDDAYLWHSEYLSFLDEAVYFYETLRDFRQEMEDNLTPVQEDLTAWKDILIEYEDWLTERLERFIEMTEISNEQAEITNAFLKDLLEWHTGLDAYVDGLLGWKGEVDDRLVDMNTWRDEMQDITNELQTIITIAGQVTATLPAVPPAVTHDDNVGNILSSIVTPALVPVVQPLNLPTWTTPNIDTALLNGILSVPAPALPTDPTDFISVNNWYNELLIWRGQLQQAAGIVTVVRDNAIPDIINRGNALHGAYTGLSTSRQQLVTSRTEISTWQGNLQTAHTNLSTWDNQLRQHYTAMNTWHNNIGQLLHSLQTAQVPTIPAHIEWQHINIPDETNLPFPGSVEALEMIELPTWDEVLASPSAYDGADLLDAFNRAFPLDGNALEPMNLDRPQGFTDYNIPEMVPYHGMLLADQPLNPLVGPPPRPDDFWSSLGLMHSQLSSFDVGAFLSDDILRMVDRSLDSYEGFLHSVRYDISFLFRDNIWLMEDIHSEYDRHLWELRNDAIDANRAEQEALHAAIYYFSTARGYTHEDTQSRLAGFAAMMPESRGALGINHDLVEFAVTPFDFAPVELREATTPAVSFAAMPNPQEFSNPFQLYQLIALVALAGVFVGTAISSIVSHVNMKRRGQAETLGFF